MGTPSIAVKLFLTFGCIFTLAFAAVIVGWQGFQRIANTQNVVIDQAIPGLRQAHELSEFNALLGSAALQFERAGTESERRELSATLFEHVDALGTFLDDLESRAPASKYRDTLRPTVSGISRNLREQSELVRQRLYHEERFARLAAKLIATTDELNELADSLVANAAATTTAIISSLYDLVEQQVDKQQLYGAFDRVVEVDLDAMERMYELRLRSSSLRALFNRVIKESDADNLLELRRQISETLSILKRRVTEINDPQRKARASALLAAMELNNGPLYVYGIFESKLALLEINRDLQHLSKENNALAASLNLIISELTADGGSLVNRVSLAAKQSLDTSRRLFGWIALVALLLTVFIFWGYVRRNVIRRLLSLEATTRSIAAGNYDVDVDVSGNDELSKMAQALRVFRNNAIEKRQVDEELHEYKNRLERLVSERTAQLEQANARLSHEVEQHAVARDRAEQASRAKTAFLATMSHELRTPLSGALGTLNLLRETSLTPAQMEYLNIVDSANTALLDIVNDILGYSQLEAGKLRIEARPFDLRSLLKNVVDLMAAQARDKDNRTILQVDEEIPELLFGDSAKLHQILLNLLGNAIKFTDAGTITVAVAVTPRTAADAVELEFQVSDTGIGIPQDQQDDLFCAFTQVDTSIARKHGGIGLGLAICDRLVAAMGGSISLRSEPDRGTTMSFLLPLSVPQGIGLSDRPTTDSSMPTESLHVLAVEDDATNRMVTSNYLQQLGHSVALADHGEAGLRLLDEEPIDLVLLDISLPGIDGLDVFRRIRAHQDPVKRGVPVVAMSAHVFKEEIEQYLGAGMDGFLGKPFSLDDLASSISLVVAGAVPALLSRATASGPLLDRETGLEDIRRLGLAKVRAMVDIFSESGAQLVSDIEHHTALGQAEQVAKLAHKLRGAAGNFGLQRLCSLLTELERACNTGALKQDPINSQLRESFEESLDALDDLLRENAGSNAESASVTG